MEIPEALERYRAHMEARIGERTRRYLGVIEPRMIRRYAIAINDLNPIYQEENAARAAGFDGLTAPPNFLAGIMDWSSGKPETELTPDGTDRDPASAALRVMGAGEEMELIRPVIAGMELYDEAAVESVELKSGRSGPLLFITIRHDFVDAAGSVFNRNRRTFLARP